MQDEFLRKKQFIINTIYIVLVIVIGVLVILSAGLIMPFWIALLLAAIMQPLIKWLDRRIKIKKKAISAVACLMFYLTVGGLLVVGFIDVMYMLDDVFENLPVYYESTIKPTLSSIQGSLQKGLTILPEQFRPDLSSLQGTLGDTLKNAVSGLSEKGISFAQKVLSGAASSFLSVLTTILLSFFVCTQYDNVVAFIKCQLPDKVKKSLKEIKPLVKDSILKFIKARIILMFITFSELSIGFLIIGMKNPIGLAAGIALLDALPVFGTGTVMIPWSLIELINGNYMGALKLFAIYVFVDVMRNVFEPKVIGTQFELNPIVALLSIYVGYQIFGILGMIGLLIAVYVLMAFQKAGKIKLFKTPESGKTFNTPKLEGTNEN